MTWLTGLGMLSTFGGRGAKNRLSDPATTRVTVAETGCCPLPACKSEARLSSGKGPEVLQKESQALGATAIRNDELAVLNQAHVLLSDMYRALTKVACNIQATNELAAFHRGSRTSLQSIFGDSSSKQTVDRDSKLLWLGNMPSAHGHPLSLGSKD